MINVETNLPRMSCVNIDPWSMALMVFKRSHRAMQVAKTESKYQIWLR